LISRLTGNICEITPEGNVVLDVNGIGFEVLVPASTAQALSSSGRGEMTTLYTHLSVREDAMVLYGFMSREELSLFRQLITVSGIGPKGALSLLSSLGADDLRFAVVSGDVKTLSRAPGIGKRTAERLVIDLRGKLEVRSYEDLENNSGAEAGGAAGGTQLPAGDAQNDAVEALTALGYPRLDSVKAVRKAAADGAEETEDLLKGALRYMA
jgi:Holliday junction DNA helicase RuvA